MRALALVEQGEVHRIRGRRDEAAHSWQAAGPHLKATGDPATDAKVRRWLAEVYEERDAADDERERLERLLARQRAAGATGEAGVTLGTLAVHLHQQGRLDEATDRAREAVAIHHALGHPFALAIDTGNLANLRYEQAAVDDAQLLYEAAIGLHRAVGNVRGLGAVTSNLAALLQHEGEGAAAADRYLEALDLHRRVGDHARLASTLAQLATLRLGQDAIGEAAAEAMLGSGFALLREHRDPVRLADLIVTRAAIELGDGSGELAFLAIDELRRLIPCAGPPKARLAQLTVTPPATSSSSPASPGSRRSGP
ncbi:MAG: hypothetical protein ABMB14_02390 [Myxococcota bacterium]